MFSSFQRKASRYHAELKAKAADLEALLPDLSKKTRNKRGLPLMILTSLFGIGAKIANTFIQQHRSEVLKRSVGVLERNHFELKERFVDFQKDMLTVTEITNDRINTVASGVNQLNKRISNLVGRTVERFKEVNESIHILERRTRAIRIVSWLTAKVILRMENDLRLYREFSEHVDNMINAVTSSIKGRIPREVIKPARFAQVLEHAAGVLYQVSPNYEFSIKDIKQLYKTRNCSVRAGRIPLLQRK